MATPKHPAVKHIKVAHKTAKDYLPLVSALITLLGFGLTLMEVDEGKGSTKNPEVDDTNPLVVIPAPPNRPLYYRPLRTIFRLLGALLKVLVGVAVVGALVWAFVTGNDVTKAVLLTVLLLASVWLASLRRA